MGGKTPHFCRWNPYSSFFRVASGQEQYRGQRCDRCFCQGALTEMAVYPCWDGIWPSDGEELGLAAWTLGFSVDWKEKLEGIRFFIDQIGGLRSTNPIQWLQYQVIQVLSISDMSPLQWWSSYNPWTHRHQFILTICRLFFRSKRLSLHPSYPVSAIEIVEMSKLFLSLHIYIYKL